MQQNLKALLERLLTHEVEFVLMGGFAAAVHGATLVTQDIDICAAPTNIPSICRAPTTSILKTDLGTLDILSPMNRPKDQQAVIELKLIKAKTK